jgi:transposase
MLALTRKAKLTDEQWRRLEPFLPPSRERQGHSRADDCERMFACLGSFRAFFLIVALTLILLGLS